MADITIVVSGESYTLTARSDELSALDAVVADRNAEIVAANVIVQAANDAAIAERTAVEAENEQITAENAQIAIVNAVLAEEETHQPLKQLRPLPEIKLHPLKTLHADGLAYLSWSVQQYATEYPSSSSADIINAARRALSSWSKTPPEPAVESFSVVQSRYKVKIDLEAELARLKYITAGAGQALEYNEAAEEAARYVATSGSGSYPMLQASVDAGEAADLATAAALIAARENAWATIGATIRRLRLTAKRAVDAAQTVEQVQAAAIVAWP